MDKPKAPKVDKKPHVLEAIENLSGAIDGLENMVSQLADRLTSVLRQSGEDRKDEGDSPSFCPLADNLQHEEFRIRKICDTANDLLNRLEI